MKHQTVMTLDSLLNVDEKITERAEGLRSSVSAITADDNKITATVSSARKAGLVYEVTINLADRTRKCTCEAHKRYRSGACKHTVAVAMVVREVLSLVI